jgi:hypothetical protein
MIALESTKFSLFETNNESGKKLLLSLNMQHKCGIKYCFFRLKQKAPAIPNRITGVFHLNVRKLTIFCLDF